MERYLIKLNLARNCLRYVIKTYNIKTIQLPYYICPTVLSAIRKEDCRIKFYHIDRNFYPTKDFNENEFILYPNYFGICSEQVLKLANKYENLIVDNAHNFYMKDCGLATFNSLRKFFPLKNGAFLHISKQIEPDFNTDKFFYEKFTTLNYHEFVSNETRLDKEDIKFISPTSEKYLNEINLITEKHRRIRKFNELHKRFSNKNELNINLHKDDVPFVYPYLTHDDNEAKKLQNEGFLILRYWNPLPKKFPEYDFYRHLIPIPLNTYQTL